MGRIQVGSVVLRRCPCLMEIEEPWLVDALMKVVLQATVFLTGWKQHRPKGGVKVGLATGSGAKDGNHGQKVWIHVALLDALYSENILATC